MTANVFVLPTPEPDEPAEGVAALGHFEAAERYLAAAETRWLHRRRNLALANAAAHLAIAASDLESKGLLP